MTRNSIQTVESDTHTHTIETTSSSPVRAVFHFPSCVEELCWCVSVVAAVDGEEVEEEDGGVHAPSSESQCPLSVLGSDIHTHSLLLAGAPAADVRTRTHTQRTDPGSDSCPTANNTERGRRGGRGGRRGRFWEKRRRMWVGVDEI